MRKLIYAPTLHGPGERSDAMIDAFKNAVPGDWRETENLINRVWDKIEKGGYTLDLDFSKTKLFPEGQVESITPAKKWQNLSTDQLRSIASSALSGLGLPSRQLGLVMTLWLKGATIENTEDPNLLEESSRLVEELEVILRKVAESGDLDAEIDEETLANAEAITSRIEDLAKERDIAIAKNINGNLREGETGILLLGGKHDVLGKLDKDIEVSLVDPELAVIQDEVREWRTLGEGKPRKSNFRENSSLGHESKE